MQESAAQAEPPAQRGWWRRLSRWAKDPTARFFAIGVLLFVAHRLVAGEERVIVVKPGVRADLERKFRDHNGRTPTAAELSQALSEWKRDEALYREALREQLDRHDPTIRTVLADKMRARAALAVTPREPSDAELQRWLGSHPALYEMPQRYEYESVTFPKAESSARELRDVYLRALNEGEDPRTLGRPIVGGRLTADVLRQRLGPELAQLLSGMPPGRWEHAENESDLLLVRLKGIHGGLPPLAEVRARVKDDLLAAERQRAVDQAVQAIVGRYHFEAPE
jgi:hypothetical protein